MELTPEQALSRVRERSLAIQAAQQDQEIAEDFLEVSRSIFDPVFNLSGTYNRRRTYERSEFITRDREDLVGVQEIIPVGQLSGGPSNDLVCVTVEGLIVETERCAFRTRHTPDANLLTPGIIDPEFASFNSDAAETWQVNFGASKLFPWGSCSCRFSFNRPKPPETLSGPQLISLAWICCFLLPIVPGPRPSSPP